MIRRRIESRIDLKIIAFLSNLRFDAESYDSTITVYFEKTGSAPQKMFKFGIIKV